MDDTFRAGAHLINYTRLVNEIPMHFTPIKMLLLPR